MENKCFLCDLRVLGVQNLLGGTNFATATIATTTAPQAAGTGH